MITLSSRRVERNFLWLSTLQICAQNCPIVVLARMLLAACPFIKLIGSLRPLLLFAILYAGGGDFSFGFSPHPSSWSDWITLGCLSSVMGSIEIIALLRYE
ncbi:hypothetical protein AKJ16_DCAP15819 [Drosera capensis]